MRQMMPLNSKGWSWVVFIRNGFLCGIEMFVEGIDEGPILKKFSFTHSINIKWYNNS